MDSLPEGWVTRASKSRSGRSYYFNTSTGQSSWKHPSLLTQQSKSEKKKEKHRHGSSSSIRSEDFNTKQSNILLSPGSPTASAVSISSRKSTMLETPVKNRNSSPDDDRSPEHKFTCSKQRAQQIAEWVTNVSDTSSTDGKSPNKKLLGTEWKQEPHAKKMKKKKKRKKDSPLDHNQCSSKTDIEGKVLFEDRASSSKLTDASSNASTIAIDDARSEDSMSCRPPLKKVKKKYKNMNKQTVSPPKPLLSPSFTSNFFSFSNVDAQQHHNRISQTNYSNQMEQQRFSTPFMKSPPLSRPIDLVTSPIHVSTQQNPTQHTVPTTLGTTKQQEYGSTEKINDIAGELMNEQRDSGFDEVIDMDIDNFEGMAHVIKAELQEVRSYFQLDIEKAKKNYLGESGPIQDGVHIILDTNVLLSHLKMINELKDLPIEGVGRPILVIPWIVMQELDSLKSDNRRQAQSNEDGGIEIATIARQAIRFLHSCFEAKHPRVRGETIDEASQQVNIMFEETNDDRILHCCLVVKRQIGNGEAVLFSNDQNLCNKAMINGVKAFNNEKLVSGLREIFQNANAIALQTGDFSEYHEQLAIQEQLAQKRAKADDILCELKCIMREGLAVAVECEMRAAYDDLWDKIVCLKPPWTVVDLLQILNKHWIAVFGDVVGRKLQTPLKELMKLLDPEKGIPGCLLNTSSILKLALQLFDAFALRSSYNGTMTKCVAAINVLQQKCQESMNDHLTRLTLPANDGPIGGALPSSEPLTPTVLDETRTINSDDTCSLSSSSLQGEINASSSKHPHAQILSTFEVIWTAVTQFSAQIFNALSYPNPIPASVIENLPKPTRNEAVSFLGLLCRSLSTLVTALQNVLRTPVEGLGDDRQSVERLVFVISSFMKEIIGQNNQMPVEALFFFCQDSNTRSALVQGVSQLDRALAMLQHCASCIV